MTNSGRGVRGKENDKAHLKLSTKRRKRGPKKKNKSSKTVPPGSTSDWTDIDDCSSAAEVGQSGSSGGNVGNASHHSFAASSQGAYCKDHRTASVNSMSSDGLNSSCAMDLETMNLCEEDLLKTPDPQEQSTTEHGERKRHATDESIGEQSSVSSHGQQGRKGQGEKRMKFSSDPETDSEVQTPRVNPELSHVGDSTVHTQLHSSKLPASFTQSESSGSCTSFLARMNIRENDLMSEITESNEDLDSMNENMTQDTGPKVNAEPGYNCDQQEKMDYEDAESEKDTYIDEERLDEEDEEPFFDEWADETEFDPNFRTEEEHRDWLNAQNDAFYDREEPDDDPAVDNEFENYEYNQDDTDNTVNNASHENLNGDDTQSKRTRKERNPFHKYSRSINMITAVHEGQKEFCRSTKHLSPDCNFFDTEFINSKPDGLKSGYIIKCGRCGLEGIIKSEYEDQNYMDLNRCAVLGAQHIGRNFIALDEMCAHMGLHSMDSQKYYALSKEIDKQHIELSKKIIKQNRAEEHRLAREAGCVGTDDIPFTEVYGDGRWATRTYGKKGVRSQSGSAVLIGARTKKVLYADTKNKYCLGCDNGLAPDEHECNRTWPKGESILGAEAQIILEGFQSTVLETVPENKLKFLRYIGDRDSVCYKKIIDADVYSGTLVEKGTCVLHIKRARIDDIMKRIDKFKISAKGFEGLDGERRELKEYLETLPPRIGKDVTSSANYWRQQDYVDGKKITDEVKRKNIAHDVKNILHHIFGDHEACAGYFCNRSDTSDTKFSIDTLKEHNIYEPLQLVMGTWSLDSSDLLRGQTTNLAESFNAQISRYTDHKAVNYQQKSALTARVHLAVIEDSTKASGSKLHEELHKIPPQTLLEFEKRRRDKNESNKKYPRRLRIRGVRFAKTDNLTQSQLYGSHPAQLDMSAGAYEEALQVHESFLKRWQDENEDVERRTRGGREQEYAYRKKLLFSDVFGDVCRMRKTTPTASLVKKILYPPIKKRAIEQYELIRKDQVKGNIAGMIECGIIIHPKKPFLATKPFGVIGDDTIVEVYAPHEMSQGDLDEAFKKNKSEVLKLLKKDKDGGIIVNRNNKTYYNIIGSLAITNKKFCRVYIAAGEGFIQITINRDDDCWNKNIEKLENFYMYHLLPEIIDSRYNRSMPLRDAERLKRINVNSQRSKPHKPSGSMHNANKEPTHEDIPAEDNHASNERNFTASGLSTKDLLLVINGNWLEDKHIDNFGLIVRRETNGLYEPQSPLLIQTPQQIKRINPMREYIQILHSGQNHWVCAFWNTQKIIIYDSLPEVMYENNIMPGGNIPKSYRTYLRKLLPEYDLEQGIEYPTIQNQGNGDDCGVFAIAVFVSLLHGLEPVLPQLRYDKPQMRRHLSRIYEQNSLEHFPLESGCRVEIPNLYEAIQREKEQQ